MSFKPVYYLECDWCDVVSEDPVPAWQNHEDEISLHLSDVPKDWKAQEEAVHSCPACNKRWEEEAEKENKA